MRRRPYPFRETTNCSSQASSLFTLSSSVQCATSDLFFLFLVRNAALTLDHSAALPSFLFFATLFLGYTDANISLVTIRFGCRRHYVG